MSFHLQGKQFTSFFFSSFFWEKHPKQYEEGMNDESSCMFEMEGDHPKI